MIQVLGFGSIELKNSGKKAFSNKGDAWRLKVDTFNKCLLLHAYFDQYNPKTTKLFVRFIRFSRVLNWAVNDQTNNRIADIQHIITLNKRLGK